MNCLLAAAWIIIVTAICVVMSINELSAQSTNEGVDRSLMGSVINITNQTNPIGAAVQQMMQATSTSNATSASNSTNQESRINWGQICRSILVDPWIAEPCETLTSPDGYTLTSEDERVLKCIGAGAAATVLGRPDLLGLGSAVGCG